MSTTAPTASPVPFATSAQYPQTLAGTRLYLRDVLALTILLTPPISPSAYSTVARFVRLVSITTTTTTNGSGANGNSNGDSNGNGSSNGNGTPASASSANPTANRFYVLALGHFPFLRHLLIDAYITNSNTWTTVLLPAPTDLQEKLLCMFRAYRAEVKNGWLRDMPRTNGEAKSPGGKEDVRDYLMVALEVLRRYIGKERDVQGGTGTGPGSWGEVCEAAEVLVGLKNDPRGPHWALGVHDRFLQVDNWDGGDPVARTGHQSQQLATVTLVGEITDVMQGI